MNANPQLSIPVGPRSRQPNYVEAGKNCRMFSRYRSAGHDRLGRARCAGAEAWRRAKRQLGASQYCLHSLKFQQRSAYRSWRRGESNSPSGKAPASPGDYSGKGVQLNLSQHGIETVSQPVTKQVKGKHRQHDGHPWEHRHPPSGDYQFPSIGYHQSPCRGRGTQANPQKA